ncbi:MAG TPA: DUF929 family protein [Nocardioides sp.]|jgi:hypothetical protein|uniref:DUF929 family protein n=1 Tax=Nocardioides sp. TaxID=35761 RepID=UPI002E367EB4|nr:DUF929 family protein [Nocardioides sp.]HEX3929261.1 DUF929 family protein [Nocardioides sp.]
MANKDQPSTPAQTSGTSKSAGKAARRQAAQAELRRVQLQQRRNRLVWMGTVVVTVVAIFAVVIVFGIMRNGGSGAKTTAATAKLTKTMASIPSSAYDSPSVVMPTNPPVSLNGATPLTEGGKPRVLYVGAEYCPFCAAERWAMVSALSRFGTFTGLGQTTSSGRDYAPNTPTLSFHGATFTSKYLVFKGYETQSNQVQGGSYAPLDKLSSADGKIFDKYDFSPYFTGSNAQGAIPFIDFAGKYASQGASYSPLMFAGLTHQKVADDITDPSTEISKSVLGTANVFTAAICQLTHNQPSSVCSASGVTAAASALPQ